LHVKVKRGASAIKNGGIIDIKGRFDSSKLHISKRGNILG